MTVTKCVDNNMALEKSNRADPQRARRHQAVFHDMHSRATKREYVRTAITPRHYPPHPDRQPEEPDRHPKGQKPERREKNHDKGDDPHDEHRERDQQHDYQDADRYGNYDPNRVHNKQDHQH